jgi:hypothetical protein
MPNRTPNLNINPDPRQTSDRAQPGDVLGVENEGKRTHLGDTAEDEDEELEDTEEEIAEQREDE